MKTLVLATVSAAALLAAGMASAQTVEQQYQNAAAQLNASAESQSASRANSFSSQDGANNSATIDQANNTAQNSTVIQGFDNFGSTGNTASVTQRGNDDRSVIMQADYNFNGNGFTGDTGGNRATVKQNGAHKNAFTYQYGSGNTSSVTQTGADDTQLTGSSVHTNAQSDVNNGTTFVAGFHSVDGATAGSNNAGARVLQDEAVGNVATVSQTGIGGDNRATVVQWYAEENEASINQLGAGNTALTYQTGYASSADETQTGLSNTASIYQVSGDQDHYGTGDNSYNNHATIHQDASFSTATSLQGGNNNQSTITQSNATDTSEARTYQMGSGQQATIKQTFGYEDKALIDQRGINDQATVNQHDSFQEAYVGQMGTGAYNNAYIDQYAGATNVSAVAYQTGSNSTVRMSQH